MPKSSELPQPTSTPTLREMQDLAFKRIPIQSEQYVSQPHATAVYVQEALFAYTIGQKHEEEGMFRREALMELSEGEIILFPDELSDLRLRAAYHGAGLVAEPSVNIPRVIHYRLSDNLSNYPPDMDYVQETLPWMYRFKPGSLKSILLHDFTIAAEDYADGDLNRLCKEPGEDELLE